jgi:hypothetical protein
MDELHDSLQATTTHTTTVARLESSPWWLNSSDLLGNCLKQCALTSCTLSVADQLKIDPLTIFTDPGWIPLGKCAPTAARNYALVILLSELADKGLKLSALGSSEMGWKDFPGYDLMISRESQMRPPQLLHPQWLSNALKMISLSKSDDKLGNRCALPSSQLGRKRIPGSSLYGTSRLTKSPQKLRPHPE